MVLGHEWEIGGTETGDSGGDNGGGGREEPEREEGPSNQGAIWKYSEPK